MVPYAPHAGQRLFHDSPAKWRLLMCGRRWGKDIASVNELIRCVVELWQGRRGKNLPLTPLVHAWIIAPTYKLAKQDWRELKRYMPAELVVKTNESDMVLSLPDDVLIECRSADNPQSLVSVGLDVVLITEAGIIPDLAWEQSIQPLLVSPGRAGLAIINGTPKGTGTWSHALYLAGQDPLEEDIASWNFSSYESPYADPADLDRLRKTMPQRWFEQEILAVFLEGGGGVFRGVDACATAAYLPPVKGHTYASGVDLARSMDFTVLTVIDAETRAVVDWQRYTDIAWPLNKKRIKQQAWRYNDAACLVDATSMQSNLVEDLRDAGVNAEPFVFTHASKTQLIEALQVAIEQQYIAIPNEPQLLTELKAFTYTKTPAGHVRMEAPTGVNDDCVISLALAWWLLTDGGEFASAVTHTEEAVAVAQPSTAVARFLAAFESEKAKERARLEGQKARRPADGADPDDLDDHAADADAEDDNEDAGGIGGIATASAGAVDPLARLLGQLNLNRTRHR